MLVHNKYFSTIDKKINYRKINNIQKYCYCALGPVVGCHYLYREIKVNVHEKIKEYLSK